MTPKPLDEVERSIHDEECEAFREAVASTWVRRNIEAAERAGRATARMPLDPILGDYVPADKHLEVPRVTCSFGTPDCLGDADGGHMDICPAWQVPGCGLCWLDFVQNHPTDHAHDEGSYEAISEGGSR